MKEDKQHYIRLDIIRDISCILILLYHLNILKGGFLAVCTFFALSGYLLCLSVLYNKNFSIKKYYISRLKKLYIPLIIVVFITVIISKLIPGIRWTNLKQESNSVIFGYNNFWQLSANLDYFTRNTNSPFLHFWFVSILLQFELIFPIGLVLLRKLDQKTQRSISTVVVILATIITTILFYYMSKTQDIMVVYYNTFARSFSIFWGILLAILHYKFSIINSNIFEKNSLFLFILYNLLLIMFCIFVTNENKNYALYMILVTIISIILINYSIVENTKMKIKHKFITVLSEISYEIYLVQYPIIFFMQKIFINESYKAVLIIFLTFIVAFILHLIIRVQVKSQKIKVARVIFIGAIIILGSYIVIKEKDYSSEMKELENRLNDNSMFMEEKANEYVNAEILEEDENSILVNNESETEEKEIQDENSMLENTENIIEEEENTENEEIIEENNDDVIEKVTNMQIVGIGDSILLGTLKEFYKVFPNGYFDGKISRNIRQANSILRDLDNQGNLPNTVILCLATNGDYSEKTNKEMMEILKDRQVYWINTMGPDDPQFNEKFEKFAENYPNIHIVDWISVGKSHPEYMEPDNIHPNYKGGKVLVNLIFEQICNDYKDE